MSSSSHHGFCWLMPQSGRPSTTARLTLPVPECCSHSVSPRYTPAFLSLTAGWRSLVALSSPLQRVCRLLRRLSAFLRHRRSYALTRDGVKTASITAAELNRLLRSICDNQQQEVKNIPPLKHAIKPTHTINYTSAVWQLINEISHINITNITIPRATLLLWLKKLSQIL